VTQLFRVGRAERADFDLGALQSCRHGQYECADVATDVKKHGSLPGVLMIFTQHRYGTAVPGMLW
jgi:hypothetical protein